MAFAFDALSKAHDCPQDRRLRTECRDGLEIRLGATDEISSIGEGFRQF
jgi:hypothetical protein